MSDSRTPPEDHPISLARAKTLMAGDYGRELLRTTARYVAPIFWVVDSSGEPTITSNGTVFFLDTGVQTLAVTANHVYEDYCRAKNNGGARCQILNLDFDPISRLIDQSAAYDIATFQITPEEIQIVDPDSGTTKIPLAGWPPCVPDVGRGIMFAGYPGIERIEFGAREMGFGVYTAVATATAVSPRNITCQIDHSELIDTLGLGLPPPGYDPGGMSGGPILTIIERQNFVSWRLGAVIYEASPDMGIIVAARAEVIQPDGRITPPWTPA